MRKNAKPALFLSFTVLYLLSSCCLSWASSVNAPCGAASGAPVIELCDGIDNDCDGLVDELFGIGEPCTVGVGECAAGGVNVCSEDGLWAVCDAVPGTPSPELCDGHDNDCDGVADEGFNVGAKCAAGLGECKVSGRFACSPDRLSAFCDAAHGEPAAEVCDGLDNDCDGSVDNGLPAPPAAGRKGVCAGAVPLCAGSAGWREPDYAALSNFQAEETICDGLDNDCDGTTDEGSASTYYADADHDTYGDPRSRIGACSPPEGHVADNTDCDDSSASRRPGGSESCNGVDDDCDGTVDEGLAVDADGDGHTSRTSCTGTRDDCNDLDPSVYPEAPERCDGKDNNCDGFADSGEKALYYQDSDADGYGSGIVRVRDCVPPRGFVRNRNDCNDNDPKVNPEAGESCSDGIDNDCDTKTDCVDSSCISDSACSEVCTDGVDNDGDRKVDCSDRDCARDAACSSYGTVEGAGGTCRDGLDNDRDGLTDCADSGCASKRACN
jgi:hypothetical protein